MTTDEPERIGPVIPPRPRPRPDEPEPMPAPDEILSAMRGNRLEAWSASIPARFTTATMADLTGWAGCDLEALTEWTTTDDPGNLLLFGDVGVGKTHAAVAACRARFGRAMPYIEVEFVPVSELLDRLDWRRPESAVFLERCCTVDLLVLDDLGTERQNEWTGERLYVVVNRRWLERRPTIVTSNLSPLGGDGSGPSLETAVGARTFSRLADGALALLLGGDDRRRTR